MRAATILACLVLGACQTVPEEVVPVGALAREDCLRNGARPGSAWWAECVRYATVLHELPPLPVAVSVPGPGRRGNRRESPRELPIYTTCSRFGQSTSCATW